jgi:hypothetical protein
LSSKKKELLLPPVRVNRIDVHQKRSVVPGNDRPGSDFVLKIWGLMPYQFRNPVEPISSIRCQYCQSRSFTTAASASLGSAALPPDGLLRIEGSPKGMRGDMRRCHGLACGPGCRAGGIIFSDFPGSGMGCK